MENPLPDLDVGGHSITCAQCGRVAWVLVPDATLCYPCARLRFPPKAEGNPLAVLADEMRRGPYEFTCIRCGAAAVRPVPTQHCYACAGTLLAEHIARVEAAERAKQEERDREHEAARRRWANIPRLEWTWERLEPRSDVVGLQEAVEAARAWAKGEGLPFLVLSGDRGSGKSHIAAAAVRGILDAGGWTHYEGVAVMLDRFRRAIGQGLGQDAVTDEIAASANLVLDDLGAERGTGQTGAGAWAQERLYLILDARWREKRRTLVTTNYSSDVLAARLGDTGQAIVDRLWDKETTCVVLLRGPSYRTGRTW